MVREIAGIELGQFGAPRSVAVKTFTEEGVRISKRSIAELRAGRMTGSIISERVTCARMLREGTPLQKDEIYEKIADIAVALRLPQVRLPHRYSSSGFTDRIAEATGIPSVTLDRVFRAMRTDMVMSAQKGAQSQMTENFQDTIDDFLRSYGDPYILRKSPTLQNLMNLNRGHHIVGPNEFYEVIYQHPGGRFIGSWVPYEVGWFAQVYADRVQAQASFSPFDREVLEAATQGNRRFLSAKLIPQTGISLNGWIIGIHLNALLGHLSLKV